MKNWILPLLLVVVMLFIAVQTHHRSVIFPEASAIAVGHWVFQIRVWRRQPSHIWILPTLGAIVGILVNNLNLSLTLKECASLAIILVLLSVFRSRVSPALSAGVLPIVLGVHSWWYVASVCILTLVIMLPTFGRSKGQAIPVTQIPVSRRILFAVVAMVWIFFWNKFGYSAYVIPPLLVAIYEAFHETELLHGTILKRSLTLTAAALIGTLLFFLLPHHVVLLGTIAIVSTLVLTQIFKVYLIPAFAISLLPIVLHVRMWEFPVSVLFSSYLMLGVIWLTNRIRRTFDGWAVS